MLDALFHVSEQPGIDEFVPKPVPSPDSAVEGDAVWAIDEAHLPNYLLPRDCPRVTYGISTETTAADRQRFFAHTNAEKIIAIEADWFHRVQNCRLYIYELAAETFEIIDRGAGYWISRSAVKPLAVREMNDLLLPILERGIELRVMPNLWPLRDALTQSSVSYSIIRVRNAKKMVE
jgi:hypothetical protein